MKLQMVKLLALLAVVLSATIALAATATLTWTANTEADLAGYKIFRGNGLCPVGPLPPLLNSSGVQVQVGKVATYIDTTVPVFDGDLCYEITAIDTSGNMSGHSNRATKAVNLVPPVAPAALGIVDVKP